jgi:cell division protein FtsB
MNRHSRASASGKKAWFPPLRKLSATRVVFLIAAIAIVYFLFNGATQAIRSHQLGEEGQRLERDLRELQQRYRRLETLGDYLNSDEYIEAVARQQLGLVRPGERSIVVISTAPTPTPAGGDGEEEEESQELWWEALIRP